MLKQHSNTDMKTTTYQMSTMIQCVVRTKSIINYVVILRLKQSQRQVIIF